MGFAEWKGCTRIGLKWKEESGSLASSRAKHCGQRELGQTRMGPEIPLDLILRTNRSQENMDPAMDRRQFLTLALLVEGGLIALAVVLAWWLEVPLLQYLRWNGSAVVWGVFATLPLCVIFLAGYLRPVGSYRRIKDFLLESLGPSLAACRWYELLLVAALAGIGEELLFRGTMQIWMDRRFGPIEGLLISNVVFALCHAITLTYTVLAFVMGLVLGLLLNAPAEPSLLAPMLTHGLYDLFAFWVLAVDWRRRQQAIPNDDSRDETVPAEDGET
jgi:uncharacterized protein